MSFLHVIRDHRAEVIAKERKASLASLVDAADELLRVANETVPFEEGVLAGSGEVSSDEQLLAARISYGGEAAAYALRQHEDTTMRHDAGRRAKWLELAARENAERLGVRISIRIKGEIA